MENAITILIADDNKYMRETLSYLISHAQGLDLVGQATNGLEAIAMAASLNPDVIMLDINMSPTNGFEATRKILKHNPHARIICLSVHRQPSYCRNMIQLGGKGYLTKSSPHQEILFAIKQVAKGEEYICEEVKIQI